MSNAQHTRARLYGHDGPFFPPELQALRDELNQVEVTRAWLDMIAHHLMGYRLVNTWNPSTSDGYNWFYGLQFSRNGHIVTVLFPKATDKEQRDGTKADRSIAVYTQKQGQQCVGDLLSKFTKVNRRRREAKQREDGRRRTPAGR